MILTESTNDQFMFSAGIRYCLSRQSYASGIGQESLRETWPTIDRENRILIACDIVAALMDGRAGDPKIDAPGWRSVGSWAFGQLDERGRQWVRDAVSPKHKPWPLDERAVPAEGGAR